jgi:hypothetical protein
LTILGDSNGFPLIINIESGNKNDAKIATNWLDSLSDDSKDIFNGKQLLADSGYDSNKFKSILDSLKCTYIIPKNNRNQSSKEYLSNKQKIIDGAKEKKKSLWKNIKTLNKTNIKNNNKLTQTKLKIREEIREVEKRKKEELKKILIEKRINIKKNRKANNKKRIFNLSLTSAERKIYKKRLHIEHTFSHIKQSKLMSINVRTKEMLINKIYNRFIDFQIMRDNKTQ